MDTMIMKMPAVALRGMVILPGMVAHFDVSRAKSIKAVEEAMMDEQKIFLVAQKDVEQENPDIEDLFKIGIIAEVKQVIKLQNNIVRILVEGKERAELSAFLENPDYLLAEIIRFDEEVDDGLPEEAKEAMLRSIQETFGKYVVVNPKMGKELQRQLSEITDLEKLMNQLANSLPVHFEEKQKILDAVSMTERYEVLMALLLKEIEIIAIKNDFQAKVKAQVDKNQKEYLLREQMKVIREELGEDNTESDADHFMDALGKIKADKEVKEKIKKEIDRFKNISSSSSESAVTRGYIETLLELPWNKTSRDNKDLKNAEQILNADHYGLEKVKERMLEFLAVRNLTSKGESPIICLVGPPGTGKTSIARSVAKALDKKYVRISLGGVRDEAEIRGHRRTYVGAMPGRIVNGLRSAGVKNPLMLLDEIDKMSSDYKGDTASALLEVLDAEQNKKFRDHYVEIPIDLSEVLFIATANSVQDIPRPLLDRMELIEVTSYTENEKLHIAKEHLLAKQMERNGIRPEQLAITDKAMAKIISGYTREAGVRNLERKLGEICRKAARPLYEGEKEKIKVTEQNLEKFLGKEKYSFDKKNDTDEVGIVRGLAWTSVGGDTLEIEVNIMPGKGEFQLTGQLGDVMKESAQAGISYIRSVSEEYHIPKKFFQENDIHIHIPEGAVPKDGPSAGITMATAMLSAITKTPIRADVAMTGEITLRGRVLPIGGLKEKTLAAKNAGIKTICVPKKNEKDIDEISPEIKKGLEIVLVEQMKDVLDVAFVKK
ncbi:endopeptidase La [Roseburia inulinivorans]|jgi:ATP-dependent Lon protease|uniref:Lon protease n=1 Tax=Roseburia inulinivorans TaxID=360807 RepID=A0A414QNC0_9FIRM|nr:endopeptidase La [Roseburia inulinivorans]RHF82293.1 endopeptidase La [Roseburia inulinivorans]